MTQPPETHIEPAVAAAPHRDRPLSPARYGHPGDVIRLIVGHRGRRRPTPGGVGGFEATAVVGLTGVGMANGPAVSAVLLYRLATYWLPVAPGWLAWRVLQRREYV